MKVNLCINGLRLDGSALEYLRLVKNANPAPRIIGESHRGEAREILEDIREQENSMYEMDINIDGRTLIDRIDHDFESIGLVPYHFSDAARMAGEVIVVGSYASIPDDGRKFRVLAVSRPHGCVRIKDSDGNEYTVPWHLPRPCSKKAPQK